MLDAFFAKPALFNSRPAAEPLGSLLARWVERLSVRGGFQSRIEALGPVNSQALEEFQEASERYEFLNTQRQDLLGSLLGALGGAGGLAGMIGGMSGAGANAPGGGLAGIAKMLGLTSTDPRQMSNDDAAKVINYARTERPELIQQTVAEKPWFMKAMGNPVVMGALAVAAAKLLNNTRRRS